MAGELKVASLTGPYQPSPKGETLAFKITVTTTSARLGALLPGAIIPKVRDPETTAPNEADPSAGVAPNHMMIQVPSAGTTNKVWMTWDNVTVPIAVNGGPGMELQPGVPYFFENCKNLLTAKTTDFYKVNAQSAFQIVSVTGNQDVSVMFFN